MGKYFGTDGYRGKAYDVLTPGHAYKIGRFIGYFSWLCQDCGKVVIGKDTRISCDDFENALCRGIKASGADSYLMGITTTPALIYTTNTKNFSYGVMISASHNPYYDNGIKIVDGNGNKIDDALIDKIEKYLDGKVAPFSSARVKGDIIEYKEANIEYIKYLQQLAPKSLKGIRVGLDTANGSAYRLANQLFAAVGIETTIINNKPNGKNINDACGSTNMAGLQKLVVDNKLDVGFAFDGDADRCLAVDNNGNIVNGDQIMYLYAKYLKETDQLSNGEIVTTVMSNIGLYKSLDKAGIKYHATPVGDKYVRQYMLEHSNQLGGEQSGHIIFGGLETTGDGLLTAIKVLEVMSATGKKLSELIMDCPIYPQVLINIKVANKKEAQEDVEVIEAIESCKTALKDKGRVLVRESGTEPLVRVMVEAETLEDCNLYANKIVDIIRTKYGI